MAMTQPPLLPDRPLFHQPWPGYWKTRLKLKRMIRLRDLIIHKENWAGHIDLAQPLAKLFPGEVVTPGTFPLAQRIDQEIRQTRRMVLWDLHAIGVDTVVIHKEHLGFGIEPEEQKYDLIMDYFRLPREGDGHAAFQAVIDNLEQGIGLYKGRLKQAWWELFNPVVWAARAIRIPITVMERAGFGAHEKTQEMLLGGYGKFMRIAMALILSFLALILGAKVPWKEIVTGIINAIFK
jgi:hypothetical protein